MLATAIQGDHRQRNPGRMPAVESRVKIGWNTGRSPVVESRANTNRGIQSERRHLRSRANAGSCARGRHRQLRSRMSPAAEFRAIIGNCDRKQNRPGKVRSPGRSPAVESRVITGSCDREQSVTQNQGFY